MERYILSKFYRPENVVEYAVSRVKESGATLDKILYPKIGEDGIWVTFVKDGMPGVYHIVKCAMGPYKLLELPMLTFYHDDEVEKFMMATLHTLPDKHTLSTANKASFEAICHWLHKEPKELLRELTEEK